MGFDHFCIGRVRPPVRFPRGRCSDTRNYKRHARAAVEARRIGRGRRAPIGPENDAVTISLPLVRLHSLGPSLPLLASHSLKWVTEKQ